MERGEAYRLMCSNAYDRVKFALASVKDDRDAREQMTYLEVAGQLLATLGPAPLVFKFLLIAGQLYDRWQPALSNVIALCCVDDCTLCHGTKVVGDEASPVGWRDCERCRMERRT